VTTKLTELTNLIEGARCNLNDISMDGGHIKRAQLMLNDAHKLVPYLVNLEAFVMKFRDDNDIYSSETVYQSDRVIENACEFIDNLMELVGWCKWTEE